MKDNLPLSIFYFLNTVYPLVIHHICEPSVRFTGRWELANWTFHIWLTNDDSHTLIVHPPPPPTQNSGQGIIGVIKFCGNQILLSKIQFYWFIHVNNVVIFSLFFHWKQKLNSVELILWSSTPTKTTKNGIQRKQLDHRIW